MRPLNHVRSNDGTSIAFDRVGQGPPLIVVGGALGTRASEASLAALLAPHATAIAYDRRGRGDSADTPPYAVEREVEDLEALIEDAGGRAHVYATSSGGNLALEAAASGVGVEKLALWEPNYLVDDSRPPLPDDYVAQLDRLLAAGRRGDAVEYFMTTAVGLPADFVAPMREAPIWDGMENVAHTLAYDGRVVAGFSLPRGRVDFIGVPTLVIDGGQTPWLSAGAEALAEALPAGEHRRIEGQPHNVAPEAIAPVLAEFFGAEHRVADATEKKKS